MGVLTESEVRRKLSQKEFQNKKEFCVKKGAIITPSAKSYLSDRNIVLKYIDDNECEDDTSIIKEVIKEVVKEKNYKYTTIFGGKLDEKPEHMTHLYGNTLVFKDHKRILLRGKVDSLEAKILETQIICQKNNLPKLVEELQEILSFVRTIMRCEVLNEKLDDFKLIGLTPDELRERSHHPEKYFGIGHEFPDYKMGEIVVAINSIRTLTREVELAAYEAFKLEYGNVERKDLIRALNRLSSVFWIMIFKVRTDKYK
ncbi:cobalamin adenosyltransferase [Romboutsia maritimum]|uniref:Cobalamin adenosyltransferase n=1 Tax=Romboutsia maritimum TaxID=2020948 RepID=A0A371ISQ0_9FIRM|nr:cobalamin adenosyltransferase [Romboutsia maritimum]RDY23493.1 cobalamin adenosyltransferase [Romboutsia maritimum]